MKRFAIVLLVAFVSSIAVAADHEAEADRAKHAAAAKDFRLEGIGFPLSTRAFFILKPDAVAISGMADSKLGTFAYFAPGKSTTSVAGLFCDGKLYEVRAFYDEHAIDKFGGVAAIKERLIARLGQPELASTKLEATGEVKDQKWVAWMFPEVMRLIQFTYNTKDKTLRIDITDMEAERVVRERKKQRTDVGF